jgi:hypothetical protein
MSSRLHTCSVPNDASAPAAPDDSVLTAAAFGRTVALRVAPPALAAVHELLPYWWSTAEGPVEKEWRVPSSAAAEAVISDLELWVAEHAEGLVFVHAGVVAFDGVALLLPGRSFSGKSTLTRELLLAGADYGSDEYAVLTPQGRVRAYPRPLAIRGDQRRRVPAAEFGATAFTGELPVGAIAALRYSATEGPSITPISPATAVLRLFDNTVCAATRPEEAFDVLVRACRDAAAVDGIRGPADETVPVLRALLHTDHRSV